MLACSLSHQKPSMRIALVNTEAQRGGAAKVAVTLAKTLAELGHEVNLYHSSDQKQQPPMIGLRRFASRQMNALLARIAGSLSIVDFGLADEIQQHSVNAEVLHIHNLHGYYLNYQKLLRHWENRPIVWTWHDQWPVTGRCGTPGPDCEKWKTGCGDCAWMNVYPAAWIDWSAQDYRTKNAIYARLNKLLIVTPSNFLRQIAITRGFSPNRVQVIPNPVMLDEFKPQSQQQARQKLGLPENQPLLLFVAANCEDPRKGYADFAKLCNDLDLAGVVVGKPPAQRAALIHYAGSFLNPGELAGYYAAADLLIMPTQADNYPNVIIEAMACGTAVLAYNVGGIPDQMPDFWDGVVEANNFSALKLRCQAILNEYALLAGLRERFRQHALANWATEVVAKQYIVAYQSAMQL